VNSRRSSAVGSRNVEATSASLLERIKAEDAAAWQRLVELYSPLVFSWCQRCGLNGEDSRDVLQEIFAAVATHIGRFRRERQGDTFRGWLRVIARNGIRLHFRRNARHPRAIGGTTAHLRIQQLAEEPLAESDPTADASEHRELFRRGLEMIRNEFEDRTWQAFWLTVVEERSSVDVCAALRMTPGAVRQARYKVVRRLRSELGDVLE
jgi:RNA polymerase sigma-70 factor, ECF subfamily